MTDGGDARTRAATFLRQRAELGAGELVLEGLTREEALALARKAAGAAEAGRPPQAGSAGAPAPARPSGPATLSPGAPARPSGPATLSPGAPARPSGPATPPAPDYPSLRAEALACTRCPLHETRTQVVFSDGHPEADLVVVGEAPGANEDRTGLPFVGAAGKFLDLLLATVDLSREESVYICNVLKCRPPGNRNPQPAEIEACAPYLRQQISFVSPRVLLAVGSFAAQLLTGQEKALGKLRGQVHAYQGVPLVVTYHPAALLRNPRWTRAFWDDLQLLRQVMDGA